MKLWLFVLVFGRFQVGKENGESSYIWEMIWTNEFQFKWKVANFPNN